MEEETIYGFDKPDKDALIEVITRSGEKKPRNQRRYDASARLLAYATSGVTARSGTTFGSGTVAAKYVGFSGASRVILDAGYTVTAYNLSTTAVGSSKYVLLSRLGDMWVVDWEEC